MKTRTFKLNKLVRDKIVKSTEAEGGTVKHRVIKKKDLTNALLTKLIEEAEELRDSNFAVGEMADLQELVDSLADHLELSKDDLLKRQAEKRQRNGAFKEGRFVDTIELPADNRWAKYYAADPKRFPEIK